MKEVTRMCWGTEATYMAVGAILELAKGRFPPKWRLEWKEYREVIA